jgi:hypothetical protein
MEATGRVERFLEAFRKLRIGNYRLHVEALPGGLNGFEEHDG